MAFSLESYAGTQGFTRAFTIEQNQRLEGFNIQTLNSLRPLHAGIHPYSLIPTEQIPLCTKPTYIAYVIWADDALTPLGFARVTTIKSKHAEGVIFIAQTETYVHPDMRNQGKGKELLGKAYEATMQIHDELTNGTDASYILEHLIIPREPEFAGLRAGMERFLEGYGFSTPFMNKPDIFVKQIR